MKSGEGNKSRRSGAVVVVVVKAVTLSIEAVEFSPNLIVFGACAVTG